MTSTLIWLHCTLIILYLFGCFFKLVTVTFDLFCTCIAVQICITLCSVIELFFSSDQFDVRECDATIIIAPIAICTMRVLYLCVINLS